MSKHNAQWPEAEAPKRLAGGFDGEGSILQIAERIAQRARAMATVQPPAPFVQLPNETQALSEGPADALPQKPAEVSTLDTAMLSLGGSGPLALDLETYGEIQGDEEAALDPVKGEIGLLSLAAESGEPVLLWHKRDPLDPVMLRQVLQDRPLVIHNARFDCKWLLTKFGIVPASLFCTLTASRLLTNGSKLPNKLGDVVERELGIHLPKDQGRSDWGGMFLTEDQLRYAANDVRHLHQLKARQLAALRTTQLEPVFDLECALIPIVIQMEHVGFAVDHLRLEQIRDGTHTQAEQLKAELVKLFGDNAELVPFFGGNAELVKLFGGKFNVDSPAQLKRALDQVGVHVESTAEETLRALDNPIVDKLLDYRAVEMQRRQACSLLDAIAPDGRIHAYFNALGSESGRFSSNGPNLQQITRGVMRSAFIAASGHKLIVVDYGQIELRAAAYLSEDEAMLSAFREGKDLHIQTAAVLLKKKPADVTKHDRQIAKSANFGLLYGQQPAGLKVYARTNYGVVLSDARAESIRSRFFSHYQGLATWHRKAHALSPYTKEGRTLLGRRRLPGPDATNWDRLQLLVNFRVQGSCADGLKLAMVRLAKELPLSARMIATVHDELVLECPEAISEEIKNLTAKIMLEEMDKVFPGLPIEVEAKICGHWGEK